MRRFFQRFLCACGLLFLIMVSSWAYEELRYGHLSPPDNVTTIWDFRRWNPSFTKATVITSGDLTYYAVEGPYARSFASSRSRYYFDGEGNYLFRNIDPGDFSRPTILAPKAQKRPIAIEDIPIR